MVYQNPPATDLQETSRHPSSPSEKSVLATVPASWTTRSYDSLGIQVQVAPWSTSQVIKSWGQLKMEVYPNPSARATHTHRAGR